MGREIRRVPKGWQHPKDDYGDYIPMYDRDYPTASAEWKKNFALWEAHAHPHYNPDYEYWEWENAPDPDTCRPAFEGDPTCYQIYETVSEGTPTSPVFETEAEIAAWLVAQGYSEKAATNFVKSAWAPSFMFMPSTGLVDGVAAMEFDDDKGKE